MYKTDILIIGAGAVGVAIAREFARYNVKVIVADKNSDVYGDATRACSSLVGKGYANTPGSFISNLSHSSRELFDTLIQELDIPFNPCGCVMPALDKDMFERIQPRLDNAQKNGDYEVVRLTRAQVLEMEPEINPEVLGGIFSPRDGVIDNFMLVIAQAENAAENGVQFLLNCKVEEIEVHKNKVGIAKTNLGDIQAKYIINAAGLHSDEISRMVEKEIDFTVHPRKGQFYLLGRDTPCKVNHIVMPVPTPHTRGKCVIPTAHGQILVGPTAEDLEDKTDYRVDVEGLSEVQADVKKMIPGIVFKNPITIFAGVRPARVPEGYNIGFSEKVEGFFSLTGIRSDGVSTSLAVAKHVVHLFKERGIRLEERNDFVSERRGIVSFSGASDAEKEMLIQQDERYGHIICRCETITEAEIIQAIHRPLGARTVDGIKRRVRAGMGRCQGGFCGPRIINILAQELGVSPTEIQKGNMNSNMLYEMTRE